MARIGTGGRTALVAGKAIAATAVFTAAMAASGAAEAHHVMGGQLPSTFVQGLLSGFGHPIIGLDHFAFVIAVGLASLATPRRFLMPIAFLAMTALGTLYHVAGGGLPVAEIVIALSVAGLGALLISQKAVPAWGYAALFAVAGLFHGYAYGESIFGAEASPLVAYLIGFVAIQYAIAIGAQEALRVVLRREASVPQAVMVRTIGAVIAGIGATFLYGAVGLA